ncbi:MAG: hypothetical protein LBP59_17490 [Planctomycetaceae bacterium]|jgi:hypothetical protein|nr:hypothetical protein [Planctomycetaceae bacterium]
MTNFYILDKNDYKREHGYAETEWLTATRNYGDAPLCPQCGESFGKMEWLPPYKIELEMFTKQYGNVVMGSSGIIVDDYFKDCFEKTDLTGLEIIDKVEVVNLLCRMGVRKKSLGSPPQYYLTKIKYGCAAMDHEKSGSAFELGKEPKCDYCRLGMIMRYSSISIDESTWDGTDIFFVRGIGGTIVTSQSFKDWWDSCNFNNCKVFPSEERNRDFYPGVSPAELAQEMLQYQK